MAMYFLISLKKNGSVEWIHQHLQEMSTKWKQRPSIPISIEVECKSRGSVPTVRVIEMEFGHMADGISKVYIKVKDVHQ